MASQQQEMSLSNPLLPSLDANEEVSATQGIHPLSQNSNQEETPETHEYTRETQEESNEKSTLRSRVEHHRQGFPQKSVLKLWWMEILSIMFSLIFLATNVGVLATLNDSLYESWEIAGVNVTPNAIVSTIATFTKACLLLPVAEVIVQLKWLYFQARTQKVSDLQIFDDASRGPLGSLRLLWKINLHSMVVSLAAIVTVLALAIEPFTQQTVRYPTRQSIAQNVTASIGTTASLLQPGLQSGEYQYFSKLQGLSVAVDSGIAAPARDALNKCPSGSCTWPGFSSLALCNSCKDVSKYITVTCSDDTRNVTDGFCTYSLGSLNDSYASVLAWNLWSKTDENTYEPVAKINISQSAQFFPYDWVYYNGMEQWVIIFRFKESYQAAGPQALETVLPVMMQCTFKWCAQYHGSTKYENGTLFDIPDFSVPIIDYSYSGEDTYLANINSLSQAQAQKFNKTTTRYQIDTGFAEDFFDMLLSSLQNTLFQDVQFGLPSTNKSKLLPPSYRPEYDHFTFQQSTMAKSYFLYYANNGDISKTMDNIALSVTNQMRSSRGATGVTGSAMYVVVYIKVVWPWFVYSAALLIAAAALLGATIWLSHGNDEMVWKSSSLALLFHGLSDDKTDGMILSTRKMEKVADGIWVRLSEDENGNFRLKVS